jgi:hypothetical protein
VTPAAILAAARAAGVTLTPDGESIRIRPAGKLPPDVRAALVAAKPLVLALLNEPPDIIHGHLEPAPPCDGCGATDLVVMIVTTSGGRYCRTCRATGGPRWSR